MPPVASFILSYLQKKQKEKEKVEEGRMQNELYVWLKTVVLKENQHDEVVSTYEKLQSIQCASPQDLVDYKIDKTDLKDDLQIPLPICVLILRCMRTYTKPLQDVSTHKSSTPLLPPQTLSITQEQQLHPLKSSADFIVLNATYVTNTKDPHTSEFKEMEVVAKMSTSINSTTQLEYEYNMIRFMNESAPGSVIQVRNLVDCDKIQLEAGCDRFSPGTKALVMEKGSYNLAEYMMMRTSLRWAERTSICTRLVEIVATVHSHRIVMMDLKPENIVYVERCTINTSPWKAIDLEGCITVDTLVQGSNAKLTVAYMAPEIFRNSSVVATFAVDAWALGMVVFFIFASKTFWTVLGLSSTDEIKNFLVNALSNPEKSQESIVKVIDNTFRGKDSLRHFLISALTIDPTQRASVTMLQNRALITGDSSITTSSVYRHIANIGDRVDEGFEKMSTQVESLSSILTRNHDEVKQQLQGISTQKQLKEYCEKIRVEMKDDVEAGLKFAVSDASDSIKEFVERVVKQHEDDMKSHFNQLGDVVTNTGKLNRHALKQENQNVLNAVTAIHENVEVMMDKMDIITVSMKEINTTVLLEKLEQVMTSQAEISADELTDQLQNVLTTKFNEMEKKLNSHEADVQQIMAQVLAERENSNIQIMVKDILNNVEALRTVQNDTMYGMHDMPLLSIISIPPQSNFMLKCKDLFTNRYLVQFLCPVCGQAAKSGKRGEGLELCVTKKWLTKLADCLSVALMVLEVAGRVGGLPIPRISELVKSVTEAVPEKVPELLTKASEVLTEFTSKNMLEYKLSGKPDMASQRPTITLEQSNQIKMLLAALNIKDCEDTGLRKAYRPEDGACAWVCGSSDKQCLKLFKETGKASLLINPVYS